MIMPLLRKLFRFVGLGGLVGRHIGQLPALSYDEIVGFEAFNARCLAQRPPRDHHGQEAPEEGLHQNEMEGE